MPNPSPLDNPIWHALHTEHSSLAVDARLARRYPAAIGPLSGMADSSPSSLDALRILAGPGGRLGLFLEDPPSSTPGWALEIGGLLSQMVADSGLPDLPDPSPSAPVRPLTPADVPQMLALAKLTNPGPFRERTIELGAFFGIFHGDQLVSMAGQRLHLPRYVEVSAVCTHPDARGRGYARTLMSIVMRDIRERGKIPFLHVFADNHDAIHVYQSLGFTQRRTLHLAVLKNEL